MESLSQLLSNFTNEEIKEILKGFSYLHNACIILFGVFSIGLYLIFNFVLSVGKGDGITKMTFSSGKLLLLGALLVSYNYALDVLFNVFGLFYSESIPPLFGEELEMTKRIVESNYEGEGEGWSKVWDTILNVLNPMNAINLIADVFNGGVSLLFVYLTRDLILLIQNGYLLVLIGVGPLAIVLEGTPFFDGSLTHWLGRFIKVLFWLLTLVVVDVIFAYGLTSKGGSGGYVILMVLLYFSIPSITGFIAKKF